MKRVIRLLSVLMAVTIILTAVLTMNASAAINYKPLFQSGIFSDTDEINGSMGYRLYVPEDYDANKPYPLLVFLHGYGERGNNTGSQIEVATIMTHYFTEERMEKYPCIILAPQCPMETTWADTTTNGNWGETDYNFNNTNENVYSKLLVKLMGKLESQYNIDSSRRYITGISMGGFGTWEVIMHHHDLFAAAAPCCGGTSSAQAENLVDLPIWNFHGAVDPTINLNGSRNMYNAMAELAENDPSLKVFKYIEAKNSKNTEKWEDIKDANYIYTEYSDVDHYCWDHAYEEQYFYEWMFNQSNESAPELANDSKCAPNLAYTGTVFDDEGGNYTDVKSTPLAAVDGDLGSSWNYKAKVTGSFLGVKWDEEKSADKVYVYWNKGNRAAANVNGYTVEYSVDGENWSAVANPKYTFSKIKGGAVVDEVKFDKVNAKAVRIKINSTVSSAHSQIFELGIFDTADAVIGGSLGTPNAKYDGVLEGMIKIEGKNIAPDGEAEDDGLEMYPGSAVGALNDGNITTTWQYNGNSPAYPVYPAIKFKGTQKAYTVALYWEDGTRASDYTVEYSADGVSFKEVPNADYRYGTAVDGITQDVITFDEVSAKAFRINIKSGENNKYYPKLYEFEIYSKNNTQPPVEQKKGDVNGDGVINSTDFMQVRRHFLKLYTIPEDKQAYADVNGDGTINSTDFMQIRRHFLKLYTIV